MPPDVFLAWLRAEYAKAFVADPYDFADARAVADELGLSRPIAVTLVRRGYRTPPRRARLLPRTSPTRRGPFRALWTRSWALVWAVIEASRSNLAGARRFRRRRRERHRADDPQDAARASGQELRLADPRPGRRRGYGLGFGNVVKLARARDRSC